LITRLQRAALKVAKRIPRPLRRRTTAHGLVLMYHRVAKPVADPWDLCVSPDSFSEHLEVLRRHADIVPLPELSRRLARKSRAKRPPAAITFDDGYFDNLDAALPILSRASAPATVFIATSWIGRREAFWWDRLAALVFTAPKLPTGIALTIGSERFAWHRPEQDDAVGEVPAAAHVGLASDGSTTSVPSPQLSRARKSLHLALWQPLQALNDDERARVLDEIEKNFSGAKPLDTSARPMTADEVRTLHRSGIIEVGAHTMSHRPLPTLSPAAQLSEIQNSRARCAEWTGVEPHSFAYPYGEFGVITPGLVAEAGFERACSTDQELMWEGRDPYRIPRFTALDWGGDGFERQLRQEWLP
jgi:peptidoglycan/xylan/chitin deacetylase (PgdA/CDA1 family)